MTLPIFTPRALQRVAMRDDAPEWAACIHAASGAPTDEPGIYIVDDGRIIPAREGHIAFTLETPRLTAEFDYTVEQLKMVGAMMRNLFEKNDAARSSYIKHASRQLIDACKQYKPGNFEYGGNCVLLALVIALSHKVSERILKGEVEACSIRQTQVRGTLEIELTLYGHASAI
jgi:hypothetical protein